MTDAEGAARVREVVRPAIGFLPLAADVPGPVRQESPICPIERDLARFLKQTATEQPQGEVLVIGCGLMQELDTAPPGLRFHVCDIDPRAVDAVLSRNDSRITGGTVVEPEPLSG